MTMKKKIQIVQGLIDLFQHAMQGFETFFLSIIKLSF